MGDEVTWGVVSRNPYRGGPVAARGREMTPEELAGAQQAAGTRARTELRRKCRYGRLDHMVTLTYRENVTDRARAKRDFQRFARMVQKWLGRAWVRVAVAEQQERGAWHWHVAVRGYQRVEVLRECWWDVVGEAGKGNVDVTYRGGADASRRVAGYMTKYMTKAFDDSARGQGEHRYWASAGLTVPVVEWQVPGGGDELEVLAKVLRRFQAAVGDGREVRAWCAPDGSLRGGVGGSVTSRPWPERADAAVRWTGDGTRPGSPVGASVGVTPGRTAVCRRYPLP